MPAFARRAWKFADSQEIKYALLQFTHILDLNSSWQLLQEMLNAIHIIKSKLKAWKGNQIIQYLQEFCKKKWSELYTVSLGVQ